MKKILTTIALITVLVASSASSVFAVERTYFANVDSVGYSALGALTIRLTDVDLAFEGKLFATDPTLEKQLLAILLTAQSLNRPIKIQTDIASASRPLIIFMFLE